MSLINSSKDSVLHFFVLKQESEFYQIQNIVYDYLTISFIENPNCFGTSISNALAVFKFNMEYAVLGPSVF